MTNLNASLDPADYPAHFPENDLSLRTQQGLSIIHNDRKFSLDELITEKHRMDMWLAHRVKGELLLHLNEADLSDDESKAARMLDRWDNTASIDSVGSVLFDAWWNTYRRGGAIHTQDWTATAPLSTPDGLADPKRAVDAFKKSVLDVKERWGAWDVSWGDVHRVRHGDVDLPLGGGSWRVGSFRVCLYSDAADGKRVMNSGDGFILAIEFDDVPRAFSILAYGQSGRTESVHHDDQVKLFAEGTLKPVSFTEQAIQETLIKSYHPTTK